MKLLKIEDGKREIDNFYLFSDFTDFAGSTHVTKDVINKTVSIIDNTKIERAFPLQEFVIELKKQNMINYLPNDYCCCYVGTSKGIYGVKDNIEGENPYWKIIMTEGYIQCYSSIDGQSWNNLSGTSISETITKQGFQKRNIKSFVLENYAVYKSPYITVQNFPEGTIVELQNESGDKLKERLFNKDMECKIFLDGLMKGRLVFKTPGGNEIYRTGIEDLQYGDVYILSPYELEIVYKGSIVSDNPTMLDSLLEKVVIKNVSGGIYTGLNISTADNSDDLIQLSLDNITYTDTIKIDINPSEEKELYIKIYKSINNHNFAVRDFQLNIE